MVRISIPGFLLRSKSGSVRGFTWNLTCQSSDPLHPERIRHQQINLLLSVMDARQRRLFAAYEAERMGLGGISQVARITGLDRKTIRRGVNELLISA